MKTETSEFFREYERLAHAIQSGIATKIGTSDEGSIGYEGCQPKHLRVGVDLALRDHASLAELLMEKGVFTEDEYKAAILQGLKYEVENLEAELSAGLGKTVTLQ